MDYRTGLVWQDCQHRRLLEMFDAVANIGEDDGNCGECVPLLQRIIEFAAGHFEIEEAYMERCGDPGREMHAREHAAFLQRLNNIVDTAAVADSSLRAEISAELTRWFRNHILEVDQEFAARVLSDRTV
ncbi:hemerythrin family protein [bacterium]|nr:hemerythrin family protein [bacterium]